MSDTEPTDGHRLVVWKWTLFGPMPGPVHIDAPEPTQWLYVGDDPSGVACVWGLTTPDLPTVDHTFHVVWTGDDLPDEAQTYIGTLQGGGLVAHVFTGRTD